MESSTNELCILCNENLQPPVRKLLEEGISGLIRASRQRIDKKHLQLKDYESVNVHEQCAKTYTSERSINVYLRTQQTIPSDVSTRSSGKLIFNYEKILNIL